MLSYFSMNRAMTALVVLVVQWFALPSVNAEQPPRPNILLIMTDDQGWWDVGMRGNQTIDTPRIDRLASEGVDFTRFYAAPVCAPTRAGLMTGRYCLRTGLYNTRFGGDSLGLQEVTIAERLQLAGYRTGCFGKWHLGKYAPYQPQERGFDEFLGHYHGHIDEYDYPDQIVHNGVPVEARRYVTDLFTDAAIEFIEASGKQPWFCYLALNAPHSPWVVGTSHDGQARGDRLIEKYQKRGCPLREARIYAMIDIIDQNLGRLLDLLARRTLDKNTVVVFMTDNGGVSKHFKAGLRGNKASIYEGGVRVPCLIRWPGKFPAGGQVTAQCSHIDLFPTFCELAGVPALTDRKMDGKSLLPLLRAGQGGTHHRYVYHTWDRYQPNPDRRWAISDPRWKLACQLRADEPLSEKRWQLFDLQEDPGETKNVRSEHPETVRRLRSEFLRWFEDVTEGQAYRPVPIPVGHPREPVIEIQPSWATWKGPHVQYVFRGYDWDTIEGWKTPGEHALWQLDVLQAGTYDVVLHYGRSGRDGGTLRLTAGQSSLDFKPQATPTADVFRRQPAGRLTLPAGKVQLRAEVVAARGKELMRLNRIILKRRD
ncbi:MAG: hypothetical protein CL681_13375 [Blastopirellula sp.]|nr:hypothetical protein [Blastopirellula sp.]